MATTLVSNASQAQIMQAQVQHIRPVLGNCKLLSSKKIFMHNLQCRLPRFTTAAHETVPARGMGRSHCQLQAEPVRASRSISVFLGRVSLHSSSFFRDLTAEAKCESHGSSGSSLCQTSLLMPELTCETGKRRFDMATWVLLLRAKPEVLVPGCRPLALPVEYLVEYQTNRLVQTSFH